MHAMQNLKQQVEALKNQEAEVRAVLLAAQDALQQRRSEVDAALKGLRTNGSANGHANHTNGASEKQRAYERVVAHVRQVINTVLPGGTHVLIASKGDERLMHQDGRTAWHFPQTERGVYAGHHPADSGAAIAHLEQLRGKGAGYLLLPSTAFWWLEHYADFRRYLDGHYHRIHGDEHCVLYRLSGDRPGDALAKRLEALGARVEALAGREAELRTQILELQEQAQRRDQQVQDVFEKLQAELAALVSQAHKSPRHKHAGINEGKKKARKARSKKGARG